MDGDGAKARAGTTTAAGHSSVNPAATQLPNGLKLSTAETSRHEQDHANNSSTSSPISKSPHPPSSSSRRTSRTRAPKETQSPATSQPASRRPSPHRETASTASNEPTGPSPYGTRSRNRAGASRPNYAEDHDDQMDFEYTGSKTSQTVTPAPSSKQQTPDMQKSASSQGRKPSAAPKPASTSKNTSVDATSNGQQGAEVGARIPGTIAFSVKEDAPQPSSSSSTSSSSKKRKAPSSSVSAAAHGPPVAKRRVSAAACVSITDKPSAMPTFEACGGKLAAHGGLVADDGTIYRANDYVYLVCEPPGEPYYIARLMEFLHANNNPSGPIDEVRINWIYRPKDIGRKATDTRILFASMHSDPCPLTSLRGKCNIRHRNEIDDFDKYRKGKDNFYFNQMYDRYMRRYYELIPMKQVINVPEHIKKALDQRWDYVSVEIGRGKELTSAVKTCKRCSMYCANSDSVDCAVCKLTYHMTCVQPPLAKKPSRGFGWSCGPCSRKQERKLEARTTNLLGDNNSRRNTDEDEEELMEEEEEAAGVDGHMSADRSSSPESVDAKIVTPKATKEQLAQAELWPYRYLGIHCKIEDSLDYDDRIYPRSSSRLGPRHQANVSIWHGQPIEYVKPAEIRRKYGKSSNRSGKNSKEALAAIEEEKRAREKRPKWVLDEPNNYVRRGEDHQNGDAACTAQLLWKAPPEGDIPRGMDDGRYDAVRSLSEPAREKLIDDYMKDCREIAKTLGLKDYHTNYLDRAIQVLTKHDFNVEAAKKEMSGTDVKKDIKEPKLTKEEQRKFEEGITKYGSNMTEVARYIGKVKGYGDVVRYYYMWKKTPRGKVIWGSYEGRKPKKKLEQPTALLADDVADDHDDSAFDNDKAGKKKRGFECKHCGCRNSRFWRRAPGVAPGAVVPADNSQKSGKDKTQQLMVALCQRCAGLYRKYGVHWEDIDDVAKRLAQTGGRAFKRKQDEELLIELININEEYRVPMAPVVAQAAAHIGMGIDQTLILPAEEIAKKKKADRVLPAPDKGTQQPTPSPAPTVASVATANDASAASVEQPPKKRVIRVVVAEKLAEPQLIPEQPRYKQQPCGVCLEEQDFGDEFFVCRQCRMTVHKRCYGIPDGRNSAKWLCDCCMNDSTGKYSTCYECVLCPARYSPFELFEPPRSTHKKKTDKEREKERLEKILIQDALVAHNKRQEEKGWPTVPREALKPTANNNWVHVSCAVFTGQIKFRNPQTLEVAEGTNAIPTHKFEQECKICKQTLGACVTCYKCPTQMHVTCAQTWNYSIGFDVTPVKSTRKDSVTTVLMGGENGTAEAIICCRDHTLKTMLHLMTEVQPDGVTNALQLYVQNFKQADLSLTGTVRKAAAINSNIRTAEKANNNRRSSVANGVAGTTTRAHRSSPGESRVQEDGEGDSHSATIAEATHKECQICGSDASPRWHQPSSGGHVCHRCHVDKLKSAPSPPDSSALPPLPADLPPVSTPAQVPTPAWQSQAPQNPHHSFDAPSMPGPSTAAAPAAASTATGAAAEAAPYEARPSVPLPPRFPQAIMNGTHHNEAPKAAQPHGSQHNNSHRSPPAPVNIAPPGPPQQQQQQQRQQLQQQPPPPPQQQQPTPSLLQSSAPHMPPSNHHGPQTGLQPSPMPPFSNGFHEHQRVPAPPLGALPQPFHGIAPPFQMSRRVQPRNIPGPPGPPGSPGPQHPGHGPGGGHPLQGHQQPYLPTLNRGLPGPPGSVGQQELERRYSPPRYSPPPTLPPPSPSNLMSPSFRHPMRVYGPSPLGPAHSPPHPQASMSPASGPVPPPSRARDMNGGYREASMGPPRGADPFAADGHRERTPPRERPNGASSSMSLKNLIH